MVGGVKALILLLVVVCVGCGGSTEKVAPKSQADSKAAGFDEMETLREKMEKLSEKEESLNETERAELTFNRFNNFKSAVDKAMEIAEQNSTDVKATSKVNNPEPQNAAPEKLIADPIVEKAIRKSLKKPTGELTKADLEKVTRLDLWLNQLTEWPKELENLTQLTVLALNDNKLTDVKGLENLTQLTRLDLDDNKLTEVPKELEKLTKLKTLFLSRNQLTSVKDLEKPRQLEVLRLDGNKLTDVKGLEKLTQLQFLSLASNQLTDSDVKGLEKLTQLTYLGLDRNQLTEIPNGLEKLTQLKELRLQDNPDLTKAQIAELQKALPKCKIGSNPRK